jgi:hypothetical protein
MTPSMFQRAICGAKNFFKTDIYLKWQNYFLTTVEDEPKRRQTENPERPIPF